MNNKCMPVLWFPTKEPRVPVWAAVQLSPIWHIEPHARPIR
jgi:hypothetical protein